MMRKTLRMYRSIDTCSSSHYDFTGSSAEYWFKGVNEHLFLPSKFYLKKWEQTEEQKETVFLLLKVVPFYISLFTLMNSRNGTRHTLSHTCCQKKPQKSLAKIRKQLNLPQFGMLTNTPRQRTNIYKSKNVQNEIFILTRLFFIMSLP